MRSSIINIIYVKLETMILIKFLYKTQWKRKGYKDIYVVHSIRFQTYLCRHLKLSLTHEISVCYCYTSYEMTDHFFMIWGLNEQLQQQLEYTLLKPDCHSWWISKIQSGRQDSLEERYAIKLCFKLGRNATETYGMLQTAFGTSCMNGESVFE